MIRWILLAVSAILGGCATTPGPYATQSESTRDSAKAQALTQRAAAIIDMDPKRAESLLREALAADLFHGPAHNDLGVIFLKRGDLYLAAGEFEWAARTLPGLPEPRMNLALTLEKAGRTDEALAAYGNALQVYQGHIPSIQGKTRLQLKSGRGDDKTRGNLEEIALRGQTQQWREWARMQLTRMAN